MNGPPKFPSARKIRILLELLVARIGTFFTSARMHGFSEGSFLQSAR